MQKSELKFAYIGTSNSHFTKKFLPGILQLNPAKLIFICIKQDEFELQPKQATNLLKKIIALKKIKLKIEELSSLVYWPFYCSQHHIQFETSKDVNSEKVKDLLNGCDFVLTAGLRSKFISNILTAPKNKIVNFHYSLLPKYRGTNPVFWQKVIADSNYGYTFHLMNQNIDDGDVVLQNQVSIDSNNSISEICDQLTLHASNQIFKLVQNLPQAKPQSKIEISTYTNDDYLKYINIHSSEHGSVWAEKCSFTKLFILNEKWIVQLEKCKQEHSTLQLSPTGKFQKNGYSFKIKKINYLPPVLYYFALRKYFE